MLRILGLSPVPDPDVVRARLVALAGLGPPGPGSGLAAREGNGEAEVGSTVSADSATAGAAPSSASAGRVLATLALVAVVAAAFLTWRTQGGAGTPTVVASGSAVSGLPTPSRSAAPAATVVVQVVGVVRHPGVVRLPAGSRVADALAAVGGARSGRSTGLLNLARRLVDGEQIVVGPQAPTIPAPAGSAGSGAGRVDLNIADEAALDSLPGVGPVTAATILAWRSAHGRFASVDQLREVEGIGPKTYDRLAPLVQVDGS